MDFDRLRVVLVDPRNPLNIGAAARAISNFGLGRLRVVNPYEIAYSEAKSAVNASQILADSQQFQTVTEAVADCTMIVGTASLGHRALALPVQRLETSARLIRDAMADGPVALLFGSEKFGLSNEHLAHCHWLCRIPTRAEHESMNLGQAVAVCLYELIRDADEVHREPVAVRPAPAEDVDRAADLLLEALRLSGYVHEITSESIELKLRRLVIRMGLNYLDAPTFQGMLRQILWKLRTGTEAQVKMTKE
ncbi:MAG: RNA methyltransferase [Bryobacteraceae bacterium]|nr:RNA methyltransferase [Bryobacteraceae bacterium]